MSEWSTCENNTQFLTRECSCEDLQSSDQSSDKSSSYSSDQSSHQSLDKSSSYSSVQSSDDQSYSYSSLCNGYTRIFQSCQTDIKSLSVEDWKTETWPVKDDTESRTFTCSSLTWYNLIQKSTPNDWESLAVEVIASHLNILSGVTCSDKHREELESADKLLLNCNWSETQTEQMKDLLSSLRDYNRGELKNKVEKDKKTVRSIKIF
jgi:hypothetical protein